MYEAPLSPREPFAPPYIEGDERMYTGTVRLSNGVSVPQLGLGTWLMDDATAMEAVRQAAGIGYRHFDTAQAYGNERGVGEGVRSCGIPRDEIFVTTKLAAEHKDYDSAMRSIDGSLERLGLDYIDLMIIHSPQPWKEVNQSDDRHFEGNLEAWNALTDAYGAGKLRAIGVSNFLQEDLANILDDCMVRPMVDQVLCHISNTPLDLMRFCEEEGIAVEAYSPIAHGEVLKDPYIAAMADRYGVTPSQLCIRYDLQLGAVTLPKTANPDHMRNDAEVDFEISDEDMEALKHMRRIESYGGSSSFPVFGGRLR